MTLVRAHNRDTVPLKGRSKIADGPGPCLIMRDGIDFAIG